MKCAFYNVLENFSLLFEKYSCKKEKYIFNFIIILTEIKNSNFVQKWFYEKSYIDCFGFKHNQNTKAHG